MKPEDTTRRRPGAIWIRSAATLLLAFLLGWAATDGGKFVGATAESSGSAQFYVGIVCLIAFAVSAYYLHDEWDKEPTASFADAQLVVGFAMTCLAMLIAAGIAGLGSAGRLHRVFPQQSDTPVTDVPDAEVVTKEIGAVTRALRPADGSGSRDDDGIRQRWETFANDVGVAAGSLRDGASDAERDEAEAALRRSRATFLVVKSEVEGRALDDAARASLLESLGQIGEFLDALEAYSPSRPSDLGIRLFATSMLAILGALLFIYVRLERMRSGRVEERRTFDRNRFLSGMWFRLGQSVVYVILLLLVVRSDVEKPVGLTESLLPLLALLVGMNVRVAESSVEGLSRKLLALVGDVGAKALELGPSEAEVDVWTTSIRQAEPREVVVDGCEFVIDAAVWRREDATMSVTLTAVDSSPPDVAVPRAAIRRAIEDRLARKDVVALRPAGSGVARIVLENDVDLAQSGFLDE